MKVELNAEVWSDFHTARGDFELVDELQRVTIEPISDFVEALEHVVLELPAIDDLDCTIRVVLDVAELQRAIGYCKDDAKGGG